MLGSCFTKVQMWLLVALYSLCSFRINLSSATFFYNFTLPVWYTYFLYNFNFATRKNAKTQKCHLHLQKNENPVFRQPQCELFELIVLHGQKSPSDHGSSSYYLHSYQNYEMLLYYMAIFTNYLHNYAFMANSYSNPN